MNPRLLPLVFAPACALAFACVTPVPDPEPAHVYVVAPQPDASADVDAAVPSFPFRPSNFTIDQLRYARLADVTVSSRCDVDGESKRLCGEENVGTALVRQSDGTDLRVLYARSIRVMPNASIKVTGTTPVAIVALGDLEILGAIDASATWDMPSPGGFQSPRKSESNGGGPGGGGAGSPSNGGGGGGYCGQGGTGASISGAVTEGGAPYGNPEITPLVGGSGGGTGGIANAGSGGGAVQLVAGGKLTIGKNATVAAGGGYGNFWGAPRIQQAAGGGSGGAILLEATEVALAGTLAANGAGGGAHRDGKDAQASANAALGGTSPDGSKGGAGSAGDDARGGDALWTGAGDNAPGGGGGAGRIRINTRSGGPVGGGVLSPSAASTCATFGAIQPL